MRGVLNILGRLQDKDNSEKIDLIKNNVREKSYNTTNIKLADLDQDFIQKWKGDIKNMWIIGEYLNESKLDSSTIHPKDDYIEI